MVQRPVKVLYIACVPHSGSTILANTLGEIDGFFSAGELFYISHQLGVDARCGCARRLSDCATWSRILETFVEDGRRTLEQIRPQDAWLLARYLPILLFHKYRGASPRALDDYKQALGDLYRAIQAATQCRVIVDASKSPSYAHLLDTAQAIDLHILHLIRDPRATAYSWRRKVNRLNMHPLKFGLLWTYWNSAIHHLWRHEPGRYLAVRYEDFVSHPQEVIRRIAELVGESADDLSFISNHLVRLSANHTVAGNEGRFRTGDVTIHADDEWKAGATARSALTTTSVTWPLQRKYGYPVRAGPLVERARLTRAAER
jgi:hypothetical protein